MKRTFKKGNEVVVSAQSKSANYRENNFVKAWLANLFLIEKVRCFVELSILPIQYSYVKVYKTTFTSYFVCLITKPY